MPTLHIDAFVPYTACPCQPMPLVDTTGSVELQKTLTEVKQRLDAREGRTCAIRLHSLNQNLAAFHKRPELVELLQTVGDAGLPVLYVNDTEVLRGRYPDVDELLALVEHATTET